MQLRKSEIRLLAICLRSLDGKPEIVKDVDDKSLGVIQVPYDLSGKARYAIARTMSKIQPEVDAIEAARNEMIRAAKDDEATLEKELNTFLAETVEVDVHKMNIEELKVDKNKLAPTVLSGLLPMLDGEI